MRKTTTTLSMIVLLAMMAALLSGCAEGPVQTRTDEVSNFDTIQIDTFGEFIIEQGDEESLTIEAPRDYMRYITSEVDNGVLTLSTRRGFMGGPIRRVTYTVYVKDLRDISLTGAGAIKIFKLNSDNLRVDLTGAGSVEIDDLTADKLEVNLTSAGAIVIAGQVDSQDVNISGVGAYEAGDLRSNDTDIRLTGAGSAVVWVEEYLDVDVTGVGSVSYFGKNPDVRENVSGLGSINSKGEH
jgi:hypothetical protein